MIQAIAVGGLGLGTATPVYAYNALLRWFPVGTASGYKVYVRQAPTYGPGLDVGNLTTETDGSIHYVVTGLPPGQTSYLAVTAYGTTGLESALSNEKSLLVTGTPAATVEPTPTSTPNATLTPVATATASTTQPSTQPPSTPTATASASPQQEIRGRIRDHWTGSAIVGTLVQLAGEAASASTYTNLAGEFTFTNIGATRWVIEPDTVAAPSGVITALDVSYALQAATSLRELTPEQAMSCDVTGNGTVSSLDAALIMRYQLGLIEQLPIAALCGSAWLFLPVPSAVPNQEVTDPHISSTVCTHGSIELDPLVDDALAQDFDGLLIGDCTGDDAPGGGAAATMEVQPVSDVTDRFQIDLYVHDAPPVESVEARLTFDGERLKVVSATVGPQEQGAVTGVNTDRPGIVSAMLATAEPIAEPRKPVLSVIVEGRVSASQLARAVEPTVFVNDTLAETSVSVRSRSRVDRPRRPRPRPHPDLVRRHDARYRK